MPERWVRRRSNQAKRDFLNQSGQIPKGFLNFSFAKLAILSSYSNSKIKYIRFSFY